MEITESPKITQNYFCNKCDYKCSRYSEWQRHISRRKHKMEVILNKMEDNKITEFKCFTCKKIYKTHSGLWKHKQKCNNNEFQKDQIINFNNEKIEQINNDITITDAKIMFELLKQNNEFKELILNQTNQMMTQMMELAKNNNTINNINNGNINNNNTNHNQFNLQLFLNETCKNAMSIDEFLEYLKPTIQELEDTARLGYVEGITRIIMRGLKDLEEELRPFHCSDLKRETLFIKNSEGEWEKETDEKQLMLKFVKAVGRKNFNNVNIWKQQNPNCRSYESKSNDMFNKILYNSSSGRTEEEQKASYEKIIKNITKEIVIDKSKKNKVK
jgi:hypothetical protein